jgi:hypothetical protein
MGRAALDPGLFAATRAGRESRCVDRGGVSRAPLMAAGDLRVDEPLQLGVDGLADELGELRPASFDERGDARLEVGVHR